MYYTLGDTTLHFYRYQCKFYVAHWDGGNVMDENLNHLSNRSLRRPGWMQNASRPPRAIILPTWINMQPGAVGRGFRLVR